MSITRRRRADGRVSYQVRVSVGGHRLPAETFDTHRDARRREAELITKRRRTSTAETCDSFAERWPEDWPIVKSGPTRGQPKSARTLDSYRERLGPFIREFRGVPLWRRRAGPGRELRPRAPSGGGGCAHDVRRRTRQRVRGKQPVRAAESGEVRWSAGSTANSPSRSCTASPTSPSTSTGRGTAR